MAIEHKTYRISDDAEDQRLDRFLRKREKGMPLSTIFKAIRVGAITVNGKKATESSRIHAGDEVVWRVTSGLKKISDQNDAAHKPLSAAHPYHHRSLPILFEDGRIIVIDKPSGVASQGGGKHTSFNLIDWARTQRPHDHLHMVHRLDAETSGVLVLAKGEKQARALSAMWRSGHIKKTYHALIWGSSILPDDLERCAGQLMHVAPLHLISPLISKQVVTIRSVFRQLIMDFQSLATRSTEIQNMMHRPSSPRLNDASCSTRHRLHSNIHPRIL